MYIHVKLAYCFLLLLLVGQLSGQSNRSIDGFGNNKFQPEWGAAGSIMPAQVSNGFADSIALPGGIFRPNARVISNEIFHQEERIFDNRELSEMVWVFGQFVDHDINLVLTDPTELELLTIPGNDQHFLPGTFIPFFRSKKVPGTGVSPQLPRLYQNEISSFIDASAIYGSDELRASWLRSFEGGELKVSEDNFLPWNTSNYNFNAPVQVSAPEMDNDTGFSDRLFVAGDVRANEHPLLLSMHILFVREHNRICREQKEKYPHWSDETLYQYARKRVGAYLQSIVYQEWLPAMGVDLPDYVGYDPSIDPSIRNEFSAAAFRLGHSMLSDDVLRLDSELDTLKRGNISLKDAFFNPLLIPIVGGIESYFLGAVNRKQQLLDSKVVDGVRNFLFGVPEAGGLDLVTLNILRGRDRGMPDYNTVRADYGLERLESLEQLTSKQELVDQLTFLYGNIDNVDLWVGLLVEDPLNGKMMGELLQEIIYQQFMALRNGDRFYFENDPSFLAEEIGEIKNTRLSDIIRRNTDISALQENVFVVQEKEEDLVIGPPLTRVHLDAVAYPNPASNHINLKYHLDSDSQLRLSIFSMTGQEIISYPFDGKEGENIQNIPLGLPEGYYNFLLESGDYFKIFRIHIDK